MRWGSVALCPHVLTWFPNASFSKQNNLVQAKSPEKGSRRRMHFCQELSVCRVVYRPAATFPYQISRRMGSMCWRVNVWPILRGVHLYNSCTPIYGIACDWLADKQINEVESPTLGVMFVFAFIGREWWVIVCVGAIRGLKYDLECLVLSRYI